MYDVRREYAIDPSGNYDGMVPVSKAAFFATVGQLDVHPWPVGKYDQTWAYLGHWVTRAGTLVGLGDGGTHLAKRRWFVTREFFNAHQDVIAEAARE
jgi:hypothetical protein